MTLTPVLQPRDLEELIATRKDVRLLDVRTPGEFESAHIAGAYNVPLDALPEHAAEIAADPHTEFVLICQSGARARKAEDALRTSGLVRLHVLDGGMNGWVAAGKPVRFGPKRMSLERQVRIVAGAIGALGALLAMSVSPWFAAVSLFVGLGLVFAGVTDTCAMATLLAKLPYNAAVTCDVPAMVQALKHGTEPVPLRRTAGTSAQNCAS
ncbi:MAG TPA: rhodanese-like domain-containing protein [Thermoanaerobaculia bacterium]|nr:rhodanese-like domain-containing protein [Thermoanaerobaculia bacterium]